MGAQTIDLANWAAQLRQPVALATLLAEPSPLLLKVGLGTMLTALVRLPLAGSEHTDYQAILNTLGQVCLRDMEPDWYAFHAGQPRQKLRLPGHCSDRQRCWPLLYN